MGEKMEKFYVEGDYTNICCLSNLNYSIKDDLQKQMYEYMKVTMEPKEVTDYTVVIAKSIPKLSLYELLNGKKIYFDKRKKIIYTELGNCSDTEGIVYIKRLIESLRNRILESKGGIFLHASAISIGNDVCIFIGNKEAGKTTTMLNYLSHGNADYVANNRICLFPKNETIKVIGSPTNIGVHYDTILNNEILKEKFKDIEDKKDNEGRILISLNELKNRLNIYEKPIANLKNVFYLQHGNKKNIDLRKISFEQIINNIEGQVVDGVFSENSILKNTYDVNQNSLYQMLKNKSISYFTFIQDGDCTKMLQKVLEERQVENEI